MQPNEEAVRGFLREKVLAALADRGKQAGQELDTVNFVEAGIIDSLGFARLLRDVEERFGTEIDMSEADPEELATITGLTVAVVKSSLS